MAGNRKQWQPFKQKIATASIIYKLGVCLLLILSVSSATAATTKHDTAQLALPDYPVDSNIEKSSNAIPEEGGIDTHTKYLAKKPQATTEYASDVQLQFADQLEKPYPYRARPPGGDSSKDFEDDAYPWKRSGSVRATLNASLSVALSETTSPKTSYPDEQQNQTTTCQTASESWSTEEQLYSDGSTTTSGDEESTTLSSSTSESSDVTTTAETFASTTSSQSSTQPAPTETVPPSTTDMPGEMNSNSALILSKTTIATTNDMLDESTTAAGEEIQQPITEAGDDALTFGATSKIVTTNDSIRDNVKLDSTTATTPAEVSEKPFFASTEKTTIRSATLASPQSTPASIETYSSVTNWPEERTVGSSTETGTNSPPPADDVTLLVKIVFEGSWHDVCSKLPILRQSLANMVDNSAEKPIYPDQIMFHQAQCSTNLTLTQTVQKMILTSLLVYIVDKNGKFDEALTKILPALYEMAPINFPLTIHSFELVQEFDSGNTIAVIIVSCVAVICILLLALLVFIMRKRQGRFNYGERCRPVSLDAYSLDSVSAYSSVRRNKAAPRSSKRSYGNPTFEDSSAVPSHPLNLAGMLAFYNDVSAIAQEFASIPQVSLKIDELPAGAELKNRYANVIPLPETRVPLQMLNNDPLTEYINASYVRGPKNVSKYYIACQAPTESTVDDFWRMIWEQQCKVVIMLTDLVENGVEKCTEYVPPLEVSDCHRLYGDYQVTLKKREAREKYAISTLHLKHLENNTFREVSHIWYLWPANGVPSDEASLISVLLEARALQRASAGPILVHCSPGTGRTGTLIALDLCIRQYEVTRTVDVPRVVYTIRRDRAGAVQTRDQYAFIYKGLNLYASKLAGGSIETI